MSSWLTLSFALTFNLGWFAGSWSILNWQWWVIASIAVIFSIVCEKLAVRS